MSNFKIALFTKVDYKENFRNKKLKQYIKGALPLIRKKYKTNGIKMLTTNKKLSQITPKQFFSFHPTPRLPSEA